MILDMMLAWRQNTVQWSAELCEKVILRHKFDTLIDDASKITMNKCPFQPNHGNGEHILSLCRHIMDKYAAIYPLITLFMTHTTNMYMNKEHKYTFEIIY